MVSENKVIILSTNLPTTSSEHINTITAVDKTDAIRTNNWLFEANSEDKTNVGIRWIRKIDREFLPAFVNNGILLSGIIIIIPRINNDDIANIIILLRTSTGMVYGYIIILSVVRLYLIVTKYAKKTDIEVREAPFI